MTKLQNSILHRRTDRRVLKPFVNKAEILKIHLQNITEILVLRHNYTHKEIVSAKAECERLGDKL